MVNRDEILQSAVRATRLGDIEAFNAVVETLQAGLISMARGYFRNHEDAIEMTQEFFIHLYERLNRYHEKSSFRSWSYTVARNFFLKKSKRKKISTTALPDESLLSGPQNRTGQAILTEEETRQEVEIALNSLPEKYSLPLRLFYYEEFSYNELAEITGLPVGTVRTHLYQGKKRLKGLLGHCGPDWGKEYG